MGGLCSKGSAVDKSPSDTTLGSDRAVHGHERRAVKDERKTAVREAAYKRMQEQQQEQHQQPAVASVLEAPVSGAAIDTEAVPWDGVPQLARLPSQKSVAKASAAKLPHTAQLAPCARRNCSIVLMFEDNTD